MLAVNVLPSAMVRVALVAGAVIATLFTEVAVATPIVGVTSVGDVSKTSPPLPVSPVTADARLALDGVARNVATPVPRPLTPVEIGKPVQLVSVPLVGVPSKGVTNVGEVSNTRPPLPVSPVTAEARFALDGVAKKVATPVPRPDTPVEMGRPVQLVNVPLVGVPKRGVVSVGDVAKTRSPEPVSSEITPASSDEVVALRAESLLLA